MSPSSFQIGATFGMLAVLGILAYRRMPVDEVKYSGYILARMRYEINLSPEAAHDLRLLKARIRAEIKDALEKHLRYEPARVSKSRIKRLQGLSCPQYRLRVGEIRVYYDIRKQVVEVLAIISKSEAASWLEELGE
jgi:mRNA interferase RelE/StbE